MEHSAIITLFHKIFVSRVCVCMCVYVCVRERLLHKHEIIIQSSFTVDHSQQHVEVTNRTVSYSGSGVGNLLKFEPCLYIL